MICKSANDNKHECMQSFEEFLFKMQELCIHTCVMDRQAGLKQFWGKYNKIGALQVDYEEKRGKVRYIP